MGKIIIAQINGAFEGCEGFVFVTDEGAAASKIVKDDRIIGAKAGETLVDFEAFPVKALPGVRLRQRNQGLDIMRTAFDDPFVKPDFKFKHVVFFSSIGHEASFLCHFEDGGNPDEKSRFLAPEISQPF